MICPQCAEEAEDGALYCRECHNLFLGERLDTMPDGDERIILLVQGCELLLRGEWSLTEFRQWLNEFTVEQEKREAAVQSVYANVPYGLEEDFQEEIDMGFQGVNQVKAALASLAEYDPEFTSMSLLNTALMQFYRGVSIVKEAMNINRRNRGRPIWI